MISSKKRRAKALQVRRKVQTMEFSFAFGNVQEEQKGREQERVQGGIKIEEKEDELSS